MKRSRWLVTGCAGFIGGHLVDRLLDMGQEVVGIDDFSTGSRETVKGLLARKGAESFRFIEGSVVDAATIAAACDGVDVVLHQAAIGSVPRSIADPLRTHVANVDGFVALALAARRANVGRVVYASSSSVYGDDPSLIKRESVIGRPLSPYAASKLASEVYARVYERTYGVTFVGLRYFNVFGPRQSPDGPYAAVIPLWLTRLTSGGQCEVFGDGSTSRDFCFIENVVNANLLAGLADLSGTQERIFNIACGESTSLLELHALLASAVRENCFVLNTAAPAFKPERPGDIRHSLADVSLAGRWLSYAPLIDVREGVRRTVEEYCRVLRSAQESCR